MSEPEPLRLDLRAFLGILRRRLWVLVLVPALVAGAAYAAASLGTPLYRSSAEILIGRTQAETIFDPLGAGAGNPERVLANQIRVIGSRPVTDAARERLGFTAEIDASFSRTEDVITLTAVDPLPRRAAAIVDAYAGAYLEYRRASGATENATSQAELRRQVDAAQARLDALDRAVAGQPPALQDQIRAAQAAERLPLLSQVATQRAQLAQLEAAANVDRGGAQLLAPADVPRSPFEPDPRRSGLLGMAVGLLLGLGMALTLDHLDNRVRSKEDLEKATGGLPVLGLIPSLPGWRDRKATHVATIEDAASASAEAYRSLRTSIEFLGLDRSLRTLQFTSPAMSDGKTTTLVNLAVALARAGRRVVVVDLDMRRPRVHEFFGLEGDTGFSSALVGDVALSDALCRVPGLPGLVVLPCGPVPPNPSELLSSKRTAEMIAALKAESDFVLIDSPPVLPVSDAVALSTVVDGTLLVVTAGGTQRRQLGRALELLHQVEARVVGTVLNRAGGRRGGHEGYGYGYKSYAEDGSRRRPPSQRKAGAEPERPGPRPRRQPRVRG